MLIYRISQMRKQVQRGKVTCPRLHSKRTHPRKEAHQEPWDRADHCFCPSHLPGAHLGKLFLIYQEPPLCLPWSLEVKDVDSTIQMGK